ncbi:MAG TPA: VWA domain-containing protein [Chitinophagales bacterium]|nr:VWA domain-containing protein [Chitinophagales bacterium]
MEFSINIKQGFRNLLLKIFLVCCLTSIVYSLFSQQTQVYKPNISRILFVLDGSGSMKQTWDGKPKFEMAKELLFKLIDSVERKNPNVEFAVRVFGFQSPNYDRNCKDSKLLIPFAKNNASKINTGLGNIHPQGMSPIAYSIELGAKDFPDDEHSLNSIILITDGEETCGGDPCKISKGLLAKRISLKPFIVGLNVDTNAYDKFKCIGAFFDTHDEASFYNTVGIIIKQTLNTTTAQVNLLDQNGNPTITNIPFTLYDHLTGKIEYNFIHTMNEKGNPDTLYLDPVGVYDLELHTFPPIRKNEIELTPGKHNIIALDVPTGSLNVECAGASVANNNAQVLVRNKGQKGILNIQGFNSESNYISGGYKLEALTTPETIIDTAILPGTLNHLKVPIYGTLTIMANDVLLASVYAAATNPLHMVQSFTMDNKVMNVQLQPGSYLIVYRPKNSYRSNSTKTKSFTIEESRTTVLNL